MDALSDRWIFLVNKRLRGGLGFPRLHACTRPGFTGDKTYNAALKGAGYRKRAMTDSRICGLVRHM
jgi:hypothetical protein